MRRLNKMQLRALLVMSCLIAPTVVWAQAAPLNLYQLDGFAEYIRCTTACGPLDAACLATCPEENFERWDKDLSGDVETKDAELALLEYWDDYELSYICYEKIVGDTTEMFPPDACESDCKVVPYYLCGAAECLETHSEEECADRDEDGLRAWQEALSGNDTSDWDANLPCDSLDDTESCGFTKECSEFDVDGDSGSETEFRCVDKDCGEGCTAFHLETVSVNNNELIIYVYYDFSPAEATILDLYIDYNLDYLTLVDARPLEALLNIPCIDDASQTCPKEISVSQELDGRLRLTVMSTTSTEPIPYGEGPIVELVFNRIGNGQTTVEFATVDHLQQMSIAPLQGENWQEELVEDELWGEPIQVAARDPNGPRMLLYYSFDNPDELLTYSDVKSGEELCDLIEECSLWDDANPQEKAVKDKLRARLGNLQRGAGRISESIEAVVGQGAYFDGKTDHLEFPITVNDPGPNPNDGRKYFLHTDQSFSLSTWFYTEGDETLDIDENGQVIFSRNDNSENTRFGVALRRGEGEDVDLIWFKESIDAGDDAFNNSVRTIKTNIDVRKWTYLGVAFRDNLKGVDDDGDGLVDELDEFDSVAFYVDDELISFDPNENVDDDADGLTDEEDEHYMPFETVEDQGQGTFEPVYDDTFELQCPFPDQAGGLKIHREGVDTGALGGTGSPESIFFASSENNLYGIEQFDPRGFARSEVYRDINSSAKDPDYSPYLDKLVYSSSESGNYEIWIADGDGSNPRQITIGFGDTARKIFARRPKWAPDGSAIIFESNAFSIPYMDNWFRRVYHLYYIQYDPMTNEVAIPLEGGQTATQLDYEYMVSSQVTHYYRVTSGEAHHHYQATWRNGVVAEGDAPNRGTIWMNVSDEHYKGKEVHVLTIPDPVRPELGTALNFEIPGTDEDTDALVDECTVNIPEVTMLDAYWIHPVDKGEQSQMLFKKEWITYEQGTEDGIGGFVEYPPYELIEDPNPAENTYSFTVVYRELDSAVLPDLYVKYDDSLVLSDIESAVINPDDGGNGFLGKDVQVGDNYTSCDQYVKIRIQSETNNTPIAQNTVIARLVFVPLTDEPIVLDEVFRAETRTLHQIVGIKDLITQETAEIDNIGNVLEFVSSGEFSPDGNRLLLAGIQNARPALVVSEDEPSYNFFNDYTESWQLDVDPDNPGHVGPIPFSKISTLPMRVEGLSWVPIEKYYPCNWIGANKNGISKLYGHAFRGGLDELKLYSYPKTSEAFFSEAARGGAWLEKQENDGTVDEQAFSCDSDLDCPPYKLCVPKNGSTVPSVCELVECDPTEAVPCQVEVECPPGETCPKVTRGACSLMPVPIGLGESTYAMDGSLSDTDTDTTPNEEEEFRWVCSVECDTDRQCLTKECLNGPCRFCDTVPEPESSPYYDTDAITSSCIECRWTENVISETIRIPEMEGCPDRNSFDCVDGSCVTECYSFENGESQYLCDPALEYCSQGRCKIFDWDWTDFAPATFSSLGETVYDLPNFHNTVAISQLYPVEIQAYGVEDYGYSPEILVEGYVETEGAKPTQYDGWFRIGSVIVYNKTQTEATQNPYVVHSPFPITDLRMRLITPTYDNLNVASTGHEDQYDDTCKENLCPTCTKWNLSAAQPPDDDGDSCDEITHYECESWSSQNACERRTPGSRATVGYRVGIPRHEARKACFERGGTDCKYSYADDKQKYLWGGQQSVIVLEVTVNGADAFNDMENRICRYAESIERVGGEWVVKANNTPVSQQEIKPGYTRPFQNYLIFGNAMTELSNQKTTYYPNPGAFDEDNDPRSVMIHDINEEGYGVLNCNVFVDEESVDEQAGLKLTVCNTEAACNVIYPTSGRIGPILETGYGNCRVETGMRNNPCYEWTGGETTIDCMTYPDSASEPWRTLDFDLHRSFGWDEGAISEPDAVLPPLT